MAKKGGGINKEKRTSHELREIVKERKMSRGSVIKALWKYIKKHKLQSEDDGRIVKLDDKLIPLFSSKLVKHKRKIVSRGSKIKIPAGHVFMTEIASALSDHLS